jgi:hypothetical protein
LQSNRKPSTAYSFKFNNIIIKLIYNVTYYKVFKWIRAFNKRTNLGKIYLVNIYIINKSKEKLNTTWLTKKNGTNWGMYL